MDPTGWRIERGRFCVLFYATTCVPCAGPRGPKRTPCASVRRWTARTHPSTSCPNTEPTTRKRFVYQWLVIYLHVFVCFFFLYLCGLIRCLHALRVCCVTPITPIPKFSSCFECRRTSLKGQRRDCPAFLITLPGVRVLSRYSTPTLPVTSRPFITPSFFKRVTSSSPTFVFYFAHYKSGFLERSC